MPSEHLELFCRKVYIMNLMFYIYVRFTQFVCVFLLCFILVICILGFFYFIWTLKCIHNIAFYLFNICKTIHYPFIYYQFSSVKSLSHVWFFATPWMAARQASLSITNSRSSPKPTPIKSVMPSSHLILCRPLFLLPPIPPSIRHFSNESTLCMRWPKYWSFSFSIIPSKEIPGLISFRMDWLDLLEVQGTLKSLLQHHSSKADSQTWVQKSGSATY